MARDSVREAIILEKGGLLSTGALCIGMALWTKLEPMYDIALIGGGMTCIGLYGWDAYRSLIGGKYKKLFEGVGLKNKKGHIPFFKRREETGKGYKLYFTLPTGMSSFDFTKKKDAIQQFLNATDISICYANYNVIIDVTDKKLKRFIEFELIKTKFKVPIVMGYSLTKLVSIDLADPNTPHLLIAGTTGGGKSNVLNVILCHLLQRENVFFRMVDLKGGVELGIYEDCKNVLTFTKDPKKVYKVMVELQEEVSKRYELFYNVGCRDIESYNKKTKGNLPRIALVIDELAELRNDKESMDVLDSLASRARACGIHIITATQRNDAEVMKGRIKQNIPAILGLKCANGTSSQVIFDRVGLEDLRGKGHGILKANGEELELQCMYITDEQIEEIVTPHRVNKKDNVIKLPKQTEIKDFNFVKELG